MEILTPLNDFASRHAGLITLIAISPIVWAILRFFYAPKRWEKLEAHFGDPANYPALLKRYQRSGADSYFSAIRTVLLWAHRLYGPKPFSARSFNMCLTIAFLYPLIAAFLAWIFANSTSPGGLVLFQDIDNGLARLWRGILAVLGLSAAAFIIANVEKFANFVVDKVTGGLDIGTTRVAFGQRRPGW